MRVALVALSLAAALSGRRSQGCSTGQLGSGRRMARTVTAPGNAAPREFLVTAPPNPQKEPLPVVLMFHGWGNTAQELADEHKFDDMAEKGSFIAVYAEGMGDYQNPAKNGSQWGSWNLGPMSSDDCEGSAAKNNSTCYESCAGACTPCSWTTCSDDVSFVDTMVGELSDQACVDMYRLYAYGESNGAMFIYKLLKERPGMLAAAVPEQGLPISGDGSVGLPSGLTTSLLHLHDRSDAYVPAAGGASSDGWKYASLDATLKSACGADAELAPVTTNATGGPRHLECQQRTGCSAHEVVSCMYDGQHGDLPDAPSAQNDHDDAFVWSFLERHISPRPYTAPAVGVVRQHGADQNAAPPLHVS